MKILQLANKLPYPPKDGGSIATFSLGRSFAELGHEVTILAMNTSKHYYDLAGLPQEVSDLLTMEGVDLDTRIRVPDALANLLFSSKPYNATRFVSNDYAGKLEDMLKANDYDIIQLEGLYLSYYLPLIRAHSNALVSMRAHNVEHEIWERNIVRQSGFKRWYIGHLAGRIKKMEVGFLNDYDVMAPITARDADRFKHLGCRLDMHVVPTGIDAGKFDTDRSGIEYPSLFHIGALDWLPNQEGLMWFLDKAWDALHDRYPDMKLYLAGRNAPDFIRKINLPNVVFLGEVDDAYDFMRSKAVMIVPLLSGSGMRIKIIEGMALGKAIVSTNIGTEGIPTTDGLDIMVANTASGFIDSISSLVNNQELFERIGKNAITFVTENFDNRTIASSLLKFYEERLR